jgi:hypothetical protein
VKFIAGDYVLNFQTGWVDASMVYGQTVERANALRTFRDGLMRTSGDLLPSFNGSDPAMSMAGHGAPNSTTRLRR